MYSRERMEKLRKSQTTITIVWTLRKTFSRFGIAINQKDYTWLSEALTNTDQV